MSRSLMLAASLAAVALAPKAAIAREPQRSEAARAADRLNDPATQIAVTAVLANLTKQLLDVPVGDFARSIGDASGDPDLREVPPDARVRDMAGPDARRLERSIARGTPRMMGAMGRMSGAIDRMMPQLRAMAGEMKKALPEY